MLYPSMTETMTVIVTIAIQWSSASATFESSRTVVDMGFGAVNTSAQNTLIAGYAVRKFIRKQRLP